MNTSAPSLLCQQRRYLPLWGRAWDDLAVENRGPKQGKVTEENVREAARLKAIWEETASRRAEDGAGTQLAFGEKYGIGSQGAVGFFLNGETALSLKAAVGFAAGMYCRVADFSPRQGHRPRWGRCLQTPSGVADGGGQSPPWTASLSSHAQLAMHIADISIDLRSIDPLE